MWHKLTHKTRWLNESEERELATHWVKEKDFHGRKVYKNTITKAKSREKPPYYIDSDDEAAAYTAKMNTDLAKEDEEDEDLVALMRKEMQAKAEIRLQEENIIKVKQEKELEKAICKEERQRRKESAVFDTKEVYEEEDDEDEDDTIRNEQIEERKKHQKKLRKEHTRVELLTGISITPGAAAVGDVWGRNTITDVFRMLEMQNKRYKLLEHEENMRKSGMTEIKTDNGEEEKSAVGAGGGDHSVTHSILQSLPQLIGLKNLKFTKVRTLRSLINKSSKKEAPTHTATAYTEVKWIHTLSTFTNLRYMNVGDKGMNMLMSQLENNKILTSINLTGARVTSSSIVELSKLLRSMKSLTILDLSGNAVCDKGAMALAAVIRHKYAPLEHTIATQNNPELPAASQHYSSNENNHHRHISSHNHSHTLSQSLHSAADASRLVELPLLRLLLVANRITKTGAMALIAATCSEGSTCPLGYMSLSRNRMTEAEKEEIRKLVKDGVSSDTTSCGNDKMQKQDILSPTLRIDDLPSVHPDRAFSTPLGRKAVSFEDGSNLSSPPQYAIFPPNINDKRINRSHTTIVI